MTGVPTTAWMWWIGGGGLALIGLGLLLWSLLRDRSRGRRRCPRCWYDLSGTDALTCSECGHAVRRERQLFKTRRRWRGVALGGLILIAGALLGSWPSARAFDWNTVKPVSWLMRQGEAGSLQGTAARRELVRRLVRGRLSPGQIQSVIEHALEIQADPSAVWSGPSVSYNGSWGDFVEQAWDDGHLTDEQRTRYLSTAFGASLTVEAGPRIRAGQPLPVRFESGAPRLSGRWGYGSGDMMFALGHIERVSAGGAVLQSAPVVWRLGQSGMGGATSVTAFRNGLGPGTHDLRIDWRITVRRGPRRAPDRGALPIASDTAEVAVWSQVSETTFEVVPADERVVDLVRDESVRDAIRDALTVELAADSVDFRGRTVPVGNGVILVEAAPVSLRTNVERAEQSVDFAEIWDGEIVFEDVPLRR